MKLCICIIQAVATYLCSSPSLTPTLYVLYSEWTIFTIILAMFLKVAGDDNFNAMASKFDTCT